MSVKAVGEIRIPRLALRHPYVGEARALGSVFSVDEERLERVIGTDNTQRVPTVQLYGWGANVSRHTDDTGFVYFAPLQHRYSSVHTPTSSVRLRRGSVYRLHDFASHWTIDSAPVVCLFIGPYAFPRDGLAIAKLELGAVELALGGRDAPRISRGFRVPLKGEVYAADLDGGGTELVLLKDARRARLIIAHCAKCERFAVKVDKYFPMFSDHNRCLRHLHDGDVEAVVTERLAA